MRAVWFRRGEVRVHVSPSLVRAVAVKAGAGPRGVASVIEARTTRGVLFERVSDALRAVGRADLIPTVESSGTR
jgi:hypothetical protein